MNDQSTIINREFPTPLPIQPEEREVLQDRDRMTVTQWATERRVISDKTAHYSGPWSHSMTPYLVEIMESLSDRFVRQVTVQACTQSGKSEAGLNFLGWAIDCDPGPFLVVMPREDDARRRIKTRVEPMVRACPSLLRKVGGTDCINAGAESDLGEMLLYVAWAGSPAALADNPCRFIWLDEVGKYPHRSGIEADPVSLANDRISTFGLSAKVYLDSSPVLAGDIVDREFTAGDRREYWCPCPHCGKYQILQWENVWLAKDEEGHLLTEADYEDEGNSAYVCPYCDVLWSEVDRWQAVGRGIWCPDGCTVDDDGQIAGDVPASRHRSYRISALMLYPGWRTVAQLAAEWAKAIKAKKTGDIGPLQNFFNSRLARPWQDQSSRTDMDTLKEHRDTYLFGQVPWGVQAITIAIDVHLDWFRVVTVGWGFLFESWLLAADRYETTDTKELEAYDCLKGVLTKSWTLANGVSIPAACVVIDCGYRPEPVKNFCRDNRVSVFRGQLFPIRGSSARMNRHYKKIQEDNTLAVYELNPLMYKDWLYRSLYETEIPGGGYGHLAHDTPGDVLGELCSEQRVIENGYPIWKPKKTGRGNHSWDGWYYALFAAQFCRVGDLAALPDAPTQGAQPAKRPRTRQETGLLEGLPELSL